MSFIHVTKIIEVLTDDVEIHRRIVEFGHKLETPPAILHPSMSSYNGGIKTAYELFYDIISNWISRNGEKSTVSELCKILEMKMKHCAEQVEKISSALISPVRIVWHLQATSSAPVPSTSYSVIPSSSKMSLEHNRNISDDMLPETMDGKEKLAVQLIQARQGEYERAGELLQMVLQSRLEVYGPVHPKTLGTKTILASAYLHLENFDEAVKLHKEVLRVQENELGPDHPFTIQTRNLIKEIVVL